MSYDYNTLFTELNKLTLLGENTPNLDNAMVKAFGVAWDSYLLNREVYSLAKSTMYYDTIANTWLDK